MFALCYFWGFNTLFTGTKRGRRKKLKALESQLEELQGIRQEHELKLEDLKSLAGYLEEEKYFDEVKVDNITLQEYEEDYDGMDFQVFDNRDKSKTITELNNLDYYRYFDLNDDLELNPAKKVTSPVLKLNK